MTTAKVLCVFVVCEGHSFRKNSFVVVVVA